MDLLRITFAEAGHRIGYCYDYASLATELARAGFIGIVRWEVGETEDPELPS